MAVDYKFSGVESSVSPFLEQISGELRGRRYPLSQERLSIGRTTDNEIVIESDAVSRVHAFVKKEGGRFHVLDNRSTNGVSVNGARVSDYALSNGDILQVGDCLFRYSDPREVVRKGNRREFVPQPIGPVMQEIGYPPIAQRRTEPNRIFLYGAVIFGVAALLLWQGRGPSPTPANVVKQEPSIPAAHIPSFAETKIKNTVAPEVVTLKTSAPAPVAAVKAAPPPSAPPQAALEQAKKELSEEEELATYLLEGKQYLEKGDFQNAAAAFHFAMVIDPENQEAIAGIRASEYQGAPKIAASTPQPPVRKPAAKKSGPDSSEQKKKVAELLDKAKNALFKKRFGEAIALAEDARKISLPGKTDYLNQAKQVIDRALMGRKEEFGPFLALAQEKLAAGDFEGSRDLCREMLIQDPGFQEAKSCEEKASSRLQGGAGSSP